MDTSAYVAKDVVTHMNQTIPELGYNAALVGFGTGKCVNREDALVVYGPETYVRTDFSNGLSMLECAGGYTPMPQGIHAGGEAVKAGTGKVALILVSDFWMIYKEEGKAALHALDETIKARGAKVVDIDVIAHTDSDGIKEQAN